MNGEWQGRHKRAKLYLISDNNLKILGHDWNTFFFFIVHENSIVNLQKRCPIAFSLVTRKEDTLCCLRFFFFFVNWATTRNWQTKALDTGKVTLLNWPRQESRKVLNHWYHFTSERRRGEGGQGCGWGRKGGWGGGGWTQSLPLPRQMPFIPLGHQGSFFQGIKEWQ